MNGTKILAYGQRQIQYTLMRHVCRGCLREFPHSLPPSLFLSFAERPGQFFGMPERDDRGVVHFAFLTLLGKTVIAKKWLHPAWNEWPDHRDSIVFVAQNSDIDQFL